MRERIGLEILAGVMTTVMLFSTLAVATPPADSQAVEPSTETITLKIEGWICSSCEKDIRRALLAVPGVKRAEASYARGGAIVEVEQGRVRGEQLVRAVASAGNTLSSYHAQIVPNGSLTVEGQDSGGLLSWFRNLFR